MIFLSNRFLSQLREYAELERRMNKPFTTQINMLCDREYTRQAAKVESQVLLSQTIQQAVKGIVTRFPMEWSAIPF